MKVLSQCPGLRHIGDLTVSFLGWLDGVYMGDIFYAAYTQMFQPNNITAWGMSHSSIPTRLLSDSDTLNSHGRR